MFDALKHFVGGALAGAVVAAASPERWTVLPAFQDGPRVHGIAVGRRLAAHAGVVVVLALEADATLRVALVPAEGEIARVPEGDVRRDFVVSHRRPWTNRGHALELSPVCPDLCQSCGRDALAHDRERVLVDVERVLGTLDLEVVFVEGSADIAAVEMRDRPADAALLNDLPGEGPPVADRVVREYRSLSPVERARVVAALAGRVTLKEVT